MTRRPACSSASNVRPPILRNGLPGSCQVDDFARQLIARWNPDRLDAILAAGRLPAEVAREIRSMRRDVVEAHRAGLRAETLARPEQPPHDDMRELRWLQKQIESRHLGVALNRLANFHDFAGRGEWADTMRDFSVQLDTRVFQFVAISEGVEQARPTGHPRETYLTAFVSTLALAWEARTGAPPAVRPKSSNRLPTLRALFHAFAHAALADCGRSHAGRLGEFLRAGRLRKPPEK